MRQKEEKGEGVFNAKKFVGHFGFQEKGQGGNWVIWMVQNGSCGKTDGKVKMGGCGIDKFQL